MTNQKPNGKVEGEGSYTGTRDYNRDTENFKAKNKDKIEGMAKDAENALDGKEGDELRKAEEQGKSKARH